MQTIDLTGQRFGTWTVIGRAATTPTQRNAYWLCRCDCGTERAVDGGRLRRGLSGSCGCLAPEKTGAAHITHGKSDSRTYRIWRHMRDRCGNPKAKDYSDYGARGIRVCDRWQKSFAHFLGDMGEAPSGLTIERENNDGNYEPGNCRWATPQEQRFNMRSNRRIALNGRDLTVTEWARELGLKPGTVFARLNRGWNARRALGVRE